MLKKLTAYLLAAAMVLSIPAGVVSASGSESETSYEVNAVELFKALGVIKDAERYYNKFDDEMTRGEFAEVMGGFLLSRRTPEDVQLFSDVPPGHSAYKAVNVLAESGAVSGDGYGLFEPDRAISYPEALTILLRILGYGEFIGPKGGYPNGCYAVVRDYDLFRYAKLSAEPTTRNIMDLLYRAVQESLMQYSLVENNHITKKLNEDQTILSTCFDVYTTEGILTADGVTDLRSTELPVRNRVSVDGVKYLADRMYTELLGQSVTCFYKDTLNTQNTVVYIAPTRKNDILEVDAKNVYDFDNMTFHYYKENKKSAQVKLTDQADIIYNHAVVTSLDNEKMIPDEGKVRFIDNNNDGKYEVVIILSYTSFVVRTISEVDDVTLLTARETLDLPVVSVLSDGLDDTLIFDAEGNEKTVDDIKTGMTVSVAAHDTGDGIVAKEIILCEDTVYGDIIRYESDEDGSRLVIDDTAFDIAVSFEPMVKNLGFRMGASFNLDVFGNVADVIETDMSMLDLAMGYLIRVTYDRDEEKLYMKIFTELGKTVVYEVGERVTVDGVSYKGRDKAYDDLCEGGEAKPQLIVYKLSEKREVNYVDRSVSFNGPISSNYYDRLTCTVPMTSYYYQREQRSFAGKVVIDDNTRIFTIPDSPEKAEERDFGMMKASDLTTGTYPVEAYSLNNDRVPSDAVIMKASSSTMPSTSIAMAVTNVATVVNADGDITYSLSLIGMNGEAEYTVEDRDLVDRAVSQDTNDSETYKIDVGDVVRIDTNKAGQITKIVLIYDYDTGLVKNGMVFPGTFFYTARTVKVGLYRVLGEYIQVTNKDLSTLGSNVLNPTEIENQRLSKFSVVKYERVHDRLRFRLGSSKDMVPYTTNNVEYSNIVIYTHSGNEKILFVLD